MEEFEVDERTNDGGRNASSTASLLNAVASFLLSYAFSVSRACRDCFLEISGPAVESTRGTEAGERRESSSLLGSKKKGMGNNEIG